MSGLIDKRVKELTESYGVAAAIENPLSLQEILKVVRSAGPSC